MMELVSFAPSRSQPVFMARRSTSEELLWLAGKEHPSKVDDGQLGLLGHLQPGICSLGRRGWFLCLCPLWWAAEPGHPAFAGGKVSSVSICLLGSFSLVLGESACVKLLY